MADIYTKGSAEANAAKSFLHDLTYVAGVRTDNQRTNCAVGMSSYSKSASIVCDEVLNRAFNDVDSAINNLSYISVPDHLTKARYGTKTWHASEIATALVYLAECLNLFWDDLNATPYQVDAFKKTILGQEVFNRGRVTSVLQTAIANAPVASAPATSRTRTPRASGGAGTSSSGTGSSQKPVGPQSANARDLKGTPGNKLIANGSSVFRIIGDATNSSNTPKVFVRPLDSNGAAGSTNKVFFNSGQGYRDYTCWFDDVHDAKQFLEKIQNAGRVPANISNPRVVERKADARGYFIVGTEFGPCAISAYQLNEELREMLENMENVDVEEDNGWERVGQRMTNEDFDALQTNMLKY